MVNGVNRVAVNMANIMPAGGDVCADLRRDECGVYAGYFC